MRPSTTARRYAEAAFDVAQRDGTTTEWLRQLTTVQDLLQRPAIRHYFDDPNVAREEKIETLPRFFPDVEPHVLNLLRILTSKHRMHLVPQVTTEFERLLRESRGVAEATVTVARPIGDDERRQIAQQLGRALNKQVEVRTQVDPDIIGGIVVRIGDQLIDGSVAGRLERLRQQLAV